MCMSDRMIFNGYIVSAFIFSLIGFIKATNNRICSECVHVEFSSRDPSAKLPKNVVNTACLENGEDFTHSSVIVCENGVSFCRKVVGKAQMTFNGVMMEASIFSRECGSTGKQEECVEDQHYLPTVLKEKGAKDISVKAKACYCHSDYCNAAHTCRASAVVAALSVLAVVCAAMLS